MVNLWWIAGESWYVDGHFSGSKNMPLFPNLFLRDSHFGNWVGASVHWNLRLRGWGAQGSPDLVALKNLSH
jgi:hypothetical protein